MTSILRFTFPLLVLSSVVLAAPTTWNGWRGPDRDAIVQDFEPPEQWPERLEQVWSVEVGGGYSTPLVEDGRVYQQARSGSDEILWCLDIATGEVIWRAATPVAFRAGSGGQRHGAGPKSTPTLADGRIFTLSITGILTAWSAADGELLWQRDFREHLDQAHPYWGVSTSPLVEDGRLYARVGSCENGALFCLDPASGADIWVQRQHANCYSSPLVDEVDGVRQLIEFNHSGLCGVDLETGRVLWEHGYPHQGRSQNTPTPVVHGDLIVLGAEDRGMFAVRAIKEGDTWTAERVWEHRDVSMDMSSTVVSEGVVYGFSHFNRGQFFGLDPKTGNVLWKGEPRQGDNAALLAVPGHVLALTDRGGLQVLRPSRETCEILQTYSVGDRGTWTAPALIDDSLLIKDGDHLVRWKIP